MAAGRMTTGERERETTHPHKEVEIQLGRETLNTGGEGEEEVVEVQQGRGREGSIQARRQD